MIERTGSRGESFGARYDFLPPAPSIHDKSQLQTETRARPGRSPGAGLRPRPWPRAARATLPPGRPVSEAPGQKPGRLPLLGPVPPTASHGDQAVIGAASVPRACGHGRHSSQEEKTPTLHRDHQPREGPAPSPCGPKGAVDVALGGDRRVLEAGGWGPCVWCGRGQEAQTPRECSRPPDPGRLTHQQLHEDL